MLPFRIAGVVPKTIVNLLENENGGGGFLGGILGPVVKEAIEENPLGAFGPTVTNTVGGGNLFDRLNIAGVTEGRGKSPLVDLIPFAGESVSNALVETTTDGSRFPTFPDFLSQLKQPRESGFEPTPYWDLIRKDGLSPIEALKTAMEQRREAYESRGYGDRREARRDRWNEILGIDWPVG